MGSPISIRGCVRPSVRPSVGWSVTRTMTTSTTTTTTTTKMTTTTTTATNVLNVLNVTRLTMLMTMMMTITMTMLMTMTISKSKGGYHRGEKHLVLLMLIMATAASGLGRKLRKGLQTKTRLPRPSDSLGVVGRSMMVTPVQNYPHL